MAAAPAAKRHKASSDAMAALAVLNDAIASAHSPSQQVLSGELLQKVGQYLDVHSLLAAAATNSHFHDALTTEVAWYDSRWAPDEETIDAIGKLRNPNAVRFMSRLHHLVIQTDPWSAFRRMPLLPALRSLDTYRPLDVQELQQMPQIEALTLRSRQLNRRLLTALSHTPTLQKLHLEVHGQDWSESRSWIRPLFDSSPLFRDGTTIDAHCDPSRWPMLVDELPPVLKALHTVQSAFLEHLDIGYVEHLAAECQELLEARPASSQLRTLKLGLEAVMEQDMPFGEAVKHMRAMYPNLQELVLADDLLSDDEEQHVAADCLEHNVTLTFVPYSEL